LHAKKERLLAASCNGTPNAEFLPTVTDCVGCTEPKANCTIQTPDWCSSP